MQHVGGRFVVSPSDLAGFTGCEHLTQLAIAVALGERRRPRCESELTALIQRKGEEHERRFLESLRADGHTVTHVGLGPARDFDAAAGTTAEAIRAGDAYIYQAVLVADDWRGVADFLERIERPSALGPWSYQVLDTKLARHPRPEHALQLCFYSEALERIQGTRPETAAVVLGSSERFEIRLADVSAYYRRLRRRFEAALARRAPVDPYPCEACSICEFQSVCEERWRSEDHLVRVAGIRRDQVERLVGHGIASLTALAEARPETRVPKMRPQTFAGLADQARLQLEAQRSARIGWQQQPAGPGRGFSLLPRRSCGDIVFDLEGHPFFEPARGLEFLFGVLTPGGAEPGYRAFWAHDRAAEQRALEAFVDLVHARLATDPGLHVYHYGAHEPSTIKRLMGEHATREAEIDELLRRGIFVDLLTVLRQALRVGVPGYSLKNIEEAFGFVRSAPVGSGTEAILRYERWLETGDATLLAAIAAYNEEDCQATLGALEWLHALRPSELPWPEAPPVRAIPDETADALEARAALRSQLIEGAGTGTPRWLAGEILEYHRREARPAWWHYFERCGMSAEELEEDAESIGGLTSDPDTPPEPAKRSLVHSCRFPPQDHKLGPGDAHDPATGKSAGTIVAIDDAAGTLRLKRGPGLKDDPLPVALIGGGPYRDQLQRAAVLRVAASIRIGDRRYPAIESILERALPRVAEHPHGAPLHTTELETMKATALGLDHSYLFVQGPPGTGKTWSGARLVVRLLARGRRVGIAAQSHKVIHNLLREVEAAAVEAGVSFRGLKKSSADNPDSEYSGRFIGSESDHPAIVGALAGVGLLAGTAWLFSHPDLDGQLDYLVIDEAGQTALADAVAMGTAARNLILLGDPLQLAQVSQGIHPPHSGVSVLEHLLADAPTIPVDRGVFLAQSFRMHPDVCAFISEIVYAGRLHAAASAARRTTAFGTGIRFLPVVHEGNRSASDEEAERIAQEIRGMLGGAFTDEHGSVRPLHAEDFMVVAPYNAQVRRLRAALPAGVQVGTVDKFQGQQAPVVFFSMATSSGEDAPRHRGFLFSRNRLNVAISRAQCLAVLVCSPRLLEARCSSIEEMQRINALCQLVEYAEGQAERQ